MKVKKQGTCVKALAAAYESVQREGAKLKSEHDDLKQFNNEHMQKALSASEERSRKKRQKILPPLLSGMLGIDVKLD